MTRTVLASGTQTADGAEDVLEDDTANQGAVLDAYVDLSNMAAGDVVQIRVYVKLLSGGSLDEIYYMQYQNAQLDEVNYKTPVIYVPAVTEPYEYKLTLKQTAGTNRTYAWTIYKG